MRCSSPRAVPASLCLDMSLHLGKSNCCWMLLLLSHVVGSYLAVQRATPFCIIQPGTDQGKLHLSSLETSTMQTPVSGIEFGLPLVNREHKHQFCTNSDTSFWVVLGVYPVLCQSTHFPAAPTHDSTASPSSSCASQCWTGAFLTPWGWKTLPPTAENQDAEGNKPQQNEAEL